MTDEERGRSSESVRLFMSELASWVESRFPHHSHAIRQELGRRMTADRWNRVAALLASLHAIPGHGLIREEHDVRNTALAAIVVAQKMAAAGLGCTRNPDGCIDFAAWLSRQIRPRIHVQG